MKDKMSLIMVLILGISVLLSLVTMVHGTDSVLIPWAEYERTSAVGPVNYKLDAVCDSAGFVYELNTLPSEGGGGIIGGGGLGGNISIGPIHKTYPEVRGEFLENMGILYDSYKEKEFPYKLKMKDPPEEADIEWNSYSNPSAYLNVNLRADLIPWWVKGMDQKLRVQITYEKNDLEELMASTINDGVTITISQIRVMAKTDFSAELSSYQGEDIELFSSDKEYELHELGESQTVWIETSFPEETNQAGIFVEITATLEDYWGRPELAPLSGGANPINIYPMEQPDMVKGVGIPLSWYLLLLSYCFVITTLLVRTFSGKWPLWAMIPAVCLSFLAPIWFYQGMDAAMQILGSRLDGAEEGLTFGPGLYLAILAAVLLVIPLSMEIVRRIRGRSPKAVEVEEVSVFKVVSDS